MFEEKTRLAAAAIIMTDTEASDSEKKRVIDMLSGGSFRERMSKVLTYHETCERLGRKKASSAYISRLVKAGKLRKVVGTGNRAIGIDSDSVTEFISSGGSISFSDDSKK